MPLNPLSDSRLCPSGSLASNGLATNVDVKAGAEKTCLSESDPLFKKLTMWTQLLEPFDPPTPQVYASQPLHYRCRAEFRVWHQDQGCFLAMFDSTNPKTPVRVDVLPIAHPRINHLMAELMVLLHQQPQLKMRLFSVEFMITMESEAIITLCYHRQLDDDWLLVAQACAQQLSANYPCHLVGRSRGQRLIVGQAHVTARFVVNGEAFQYQQPEGCFSQPNGCMNGHMLNWVQNTLSNHVSDVLELYCGNGNFTLPIAKIARQVLATEIDKAALRATITNAEINQIHNLTAVRLSADETRDALARVRPFRRLSAIDLGDFHFDTVVVDPPRAGIDHKTCAWLKDFPQLLYVSCNPKTLAENLSHWHDSHKISACAIFDQFPGTQHLESAVFLQPRNKA